jgi:hypothetical protein
VKKQAPRGINGMSLLLGFGDHGVFKGDCQIADVWIQGCLESTERPLEDRVKEAIYLHADRHYA